MSLTIYNIVGSDGSWFSPFGWRARASLLCKRVPVEWIDVPLSQLRARLAFADAVTTPLLVERTESGENLLKDTWEIASHLEELFPEPPLFEGVPRPAIRFVERLVNDLQVRGFAAFAPIYFENDIVSGADAEVFEQIVRRATGRSVVENAAMRAELVEGFRARLSPIDAQLGGEPWLLGRFGYADILLLSCIKCFSTVCRGPDPVLGVDAFTHLRSWYEKIHDRCGIEDPY